MAFGKNHHFPIGDTYISSPSNWLVFLTYIFQPTHPRKVCSVWKVSGSKGWEEARPTSQNGMVKMMGKFIFFNGMIFGGSFPPIFWKHPSYMLYMYIWICTVDTQKVYFLKFVELFDHFPQLTTWLQDTSLVVSCYEGLPAEFKAVVLCFPQCRQTPKWEVPHLKHHRHRKKVPVVSKEVMYGSLSVFFRSGCGWIEDGPSDQCEWRIWFNVIQFLFNYNNQHGGSNASSEFDLDMNVFWMVRFFVFWCKPREVVDFGSA